MVHVGQVSVTQGLQPTTVSNSEGNLHLSEELYYYSGVILGYTAVAAGPTVGTPEVL